MLLLNRIFVKKHVAAFAILLFLIVFFIVQWIKPGFLFANDGSIRPFGLGYKHKTVIPFWFISIILAILSYTAVLYYLTYPRL